MVARFFLATAALVSGYLGFVASGLLPDLSNDSAFEVFTTSRWSHVAGVPMGYFGAVVYGAMFVLSWSYARGARWAIAVIHMMALMIGSAALLFAGLQYFFTGGRGFWLGLIHGLGLGGAIFLLMIPKPIWSSPWRNLFVGAAGVGSIVGLILIQSQQRDSSLTLTVKLDPFRALPNLTSADYGGEEKLVSLFDGEFTINPADYSVIGAPSADKFSRSYYRLLVY